MRLFLKNGYEYGKACEELKLLSPHLSDDEANEIIIKFFKFWENMSENIDLFRN